MSWSPNAPIELVQARLSAGADPETAAAMAAYMKSDMPCYGVKSPARQVIAREIKARFRPESQAEYEALVLCLWTLPHREEKYLAIAVARQHKRFWSPASLPLYERLIREGAWWDFVDEIAQHLVGEVLLRHPEKTWPVLDAWIDDSDLWIRRTAILAQNRLKAKTDASRLFAYCLAHAHEQAFFMRKAIGWALRAYADTEPEAVRAFLERHRRELSGLSYREASKHLG